MVAKVAINILANIIHWNRYRPDVLEFYAQISRYCNEVYIEHFHSILSRILADHRIAKNEFNPIRYFSLCIELCRERYDSWNETFGKASTSIHESEVLQQVKKYLEHGKCHAYIERLSTEFFEPLLQEYASCTDYDESWLSRFQFFEYTRNQTVSHVIDMGKVI